MRRIRGSTLALTVSIVGIIILALAFILFNFLQGANVQKAGQSAADAAAIAVAKQMALIVVETPTTIGKVGLVDNYSPAGVNAQPIFGINTLTGRARLDALIGKDLSNTTMQFLAKQDLSEIRTAKGALRAELLAWSKGQKLSKDASGATVPSAVEVAKAAYKVNQQNAGINSKLENIKVSVGVVGGSGGVTNIPLPEPNTDLAKIEISSSQYAEVNGRRFYRANQAIDVAAVGAFKFSEIGDDCKLSDRASFQDVTGNNDPDALPTAVRIEAREKITANASGQGGGGDEGGVQVSLTGTTSINDIACATVGGRRVSPTAGIFRLEFPQGIPQGEPVAGDTKIDFTTIRSIINASQLSVDGAPGANVWNGKGKYFTAKGGSFPGKGNIVPSQQDPTQVLYKGRASDNPSVTTAGFVYDWLKGECLRPRMDCVKAALTKDLKAFGRSGDTYSNKSERAIAMTPNGEFLMQPALAQWGDPLHTKFNTDVYGAIFDMKKFPNSDLAMLTKLDPRSIENHTRCQNEDQAAVFRMQMSAAQQCALAGPTSIAHGKNAADIVTTVDLHDIQDALDYFTALANGQVTAMNTYAAGRSAQLGPPLSPAGAYPPNLAGLSHQDAAEEITEQQNVQADKMAAAAAKAAGRRANDPVYIAAMAEHAKAKAEWDKLNPFRLEHQRIIDRAQEVQLNARQCIAEENALINNMMAFSAVGLGEVVDKKDYLVGDGIHFTPPLVAATRAQVEGSGAISTGQTNTNLGDERWCSGTGTGISNPYFASRKKKAARVFQGAGNCGRAGDFFTLPSFAAPLNIFPTSSGQNYRFTTQGDASFARDGCILISLATTPFFNASTGTQQLMRGQRQFQALNVYREKSNHPDIHLVWSVMAQNNAFNANLSSTNSFELGADARQMPNTSTPETEGNVLDCAGSTGTGQTQACRYNAGVVQVTSPLMFTNKIPDPMPVPPPPPGDPNPPVAQPPFPPPQPPPSSH